MSKPKNIQYLPFNNITDLLEKTEKLKKVYIIHSDLLKKKLIKEGIEFIEFSSYGVVIDATKIPKGKLKLIVDQTPSLIEKAYKEAGVVNKINLKY